MSAIIFTCPETGQEVSSGIDIDPESFERLPVREIMCPACNQIHNMSSAQARL